MSLPAIMLLLPCISPTQGFLVLMQVRISITVCPVFHLWGGGGWYIYYIITNTL